MTTLEQLLVLQDRDRKIIQLTRETQDIPKRKELTETRLQEHRAAVEAGQEDVKKNQSAIKQVELEIDSLREKIYKLRDQQTKIKTNEEYRAIEKEVAVLEGKIREQEEQELVLMEQAESIKAELKEKQTELKQEESVVQGDMDALDARLGNIQAEIDKLKAERTELATGIDEEWLARYERVMNNKGDVAFVPIERNGACGGCHMKLPPQVLQDVKRAEALVACNYCGRLLFWNG